MKIEYCGNTIADDAAGDFIIPGPGFEHVREVQAENLAGASAPALFDRDNRRTTITFAVSRELADRYAAFNEIFSIQSLAGSGALRISEGVEAWGGTGFLQSARLVEITGRSLVIQYQFILGLITQQA